LNEGIKLAHVGLILRTPWLLIEPKKFSIGSWLKFLNSTYVFEPTIENLLIVLIQFTTEGITFLVFVSYSLLCKTIKALRQKSQCAELKVTAFRNSFAATGLIVLLLALSSAQYLR